jgi:hypothetical protein
MRSPAELTTWGWHEAGYDQADNCLFADSGYENQNRTGEALKALGLDLFPKEGMQGDNECYSLEHFDEDGESYDEPDFMEQTYNANHILSASHTQPEVLPTNIESSTLAALPDLESTKKAVVRVSLYSAPSTADNILLP